MTILRPSLVLLFNSVNKESYSYYQHTRPYLPKSRHAPHLVVDLSEGRSSFWPFKLFLLLFGLVLAKLYLLDSIVSPHYRFKYSWLIPFFYRSRTILLDDGLDSFRNIPSNLDPELISACKYFVPSSITFPLSLGIPFWLSTSKRYSRAYRLMPVSTPTCFPDIFDSYSTCIVETRSIDTSLDLYAQSLGPIPCSSETIVIKHPNPAKASRALDLTYTRISYAISHTGVHSLPFRHLIFGSSVLPLALLSSSCCKLSEELSSLPLTITFLLEEQCLESFYLLSAHFPSSILSRVVSQKDGYLFIQSHLNT